MFMVLAFNTFVRVFALMPAGVPICMRACMLAFVCVFLCLLACLLVCVSLHRYNLATFADISENGLLIKVLAETGLPVHTPIPAYLQRDARLFFHQFVGWKVAVSQDSEAKPGVRVAAAPAAEATAAGGQTPHQQEAPIVDRSAEPEKSSKSAPAASPSKSAPTGSPAKSSPEVIKAMRLPLCFASGSFPDLAFSFARRGLADAFWRASSHSGARSRNK
jgi:hypothetical protein